MRILIVDDDSSSRELIELLLAKWGYDFTSASDGLQAWDLFQTEKFDIVVSDWIMPGLEGPDLCRRIRDYERSQSIERVGYTYFILCTVKKDTQSVVHGIEAGADDYIIMPFEHAEFRVRIEAGLRLIRLERSLASTNAKLKRGLEQAEVTLTGMLPARRTGPDLRIDWLFRPCAFIGGDLFNILTLDEKHVGLYAIDVSGHGVASALFAVTLGNMLLPRRHVDEVNGPHSESLFSWNRSPLSVVSTLNERFPLRYPTNMYSTLFYGVINREDLTMRWVRAGHPPPIVIGNKENLLLEEGDPPIGLFSGYPFTEHETKLARGDRLFLYSDGITESKGPNLDMFGIKRLASLLTDTADKPLNDAVRLIDSALLKHRGDEEFDDDLSLLAVEMI